MSINRLESQENLGRQLRMHGTIARRAPLQDLMNLRQASTFFKGGKRLLRNAFLDLKYGAFLGGTIRSPYANLGIRDTASTDYAVLPLIFEGIVQESDVLVDIGCGKGRVINWWLSQGLRNQIVGIELDEKVALKTQRRLRRHRNVQIIAGDALALLPDNGTLFYLFNPFNKPWVVAFKDRIAERSARRDARMILYYNCVHVDVFKSDPHWIVEQVALRPPFHPLALVMDRVAHARAEGDRHLTNRPRLSS